MKSLPTYINGHRTLLRRRGFTLIELLIASVLAAVLMGGVVLAAGALARDARESRSVDSESQFDAAANLIRRDLGNAQSVEFRSDGSMVLVGHGGLEPATGRSTGRLVRIAYRVVDAGRHPSRGGEGESRALLLVREQVPLDASAERTSWRELVLAGVIDLQLSPASDDAARSRSTDHAQTPVHHTPVPSRVRIRIQTNSGATERVIAVR